MKRKLLVVVALALLAAPRLDARDVPFLESPESVVSAMLDLARVTEGDTVYDLGSGDGRIVIAAAQRYGCSGVGVELDAELVARSEAAAREAGVDERVSFLRGDFFVADLRPASVVMLYLSPQVNRRLAPRLLEQLASGTRIVSHKYGIDDWKPQRRVRVEGRALFLYVVP